MGQGPKKYSSLEDMEEDVAAAAEVTESTPATDAEIKPAEVKPAEEACDGACCGCDCKKDGE